MTAFFLVPLLFTDRSLTEGDFVCASLFVKGVFTNARLKDAFISGLSYTLTYLLKEIEIGLPRRRLPAA